MTSSFVPLALVTGGARGIGAGVALALAEAGYQVLATGLTDDEVAATPGHAAIRHLKLDVTSDAQVAAVASAADGIAEQMGLLQEVAGSLALLLDR